MKNTTKILILLMVPLMAACGFDEGEEWTPVEPPASDEHDEAPIDDQMQAPEEVSAPVEPEPGVRLTCATAAFGTHAFAYVIEFGIYGAARLKSGPAHAYREWLESPEDPVRGPIDEHETHYNGDIREDYIDVSLPLFKLELEATHPGYFRGRTHLADHGEEDIECWTPNFAPPFRYDGETGVCKNEGGDVGWNQTGVIALRETGFGECADLRGVSINEDALRYPVLQGMNLAGANLEGAEFYFALLEDADLRGTQMLTLGFGYAWLSGRIDAHSRVSDAEECIVNETEWSCFR